MKSSLKLIPMLIAWSLSIGASDASSICAIVMRNKVVLASDSKVTSDGDTKNEITEKAYSVPKKRMFGSVGLHTGSDFNVRELAKECSEQASSVADCADRFEVAAKARLVNTAEMLRHTNPSAFATRFGAGKNVLEFVYFGFEHGAFVACTKAFDVRSQADGSLVSTVINSNSWTVNEGVQILFFGEQEAAKKLFAERGSANYFKERGVVSGLAELIRIEVRDKPQAVGLPINCIEMTDDGAVRTVGEPVCSNGIDH